MPCPFALSPPARVRGGGSQLISGPPSCCLEDAADTCALYCLRLAVSSPISGLTRPSWVRILSGRGSAELAEEWRKLGRELKVLSISFQQNQVVVPAQAGLHPQWGKPGSLAAVRGWWALRFRVSTFLPFWGFLGSQGACGEDCRSRWDYQWVKQHPVHCHQVPEACHGSGTLRRWANGAEQR